MDNVKIINDLNGIFIQDFGKDILESGGKQKHFFSDAIGLKAYELVFLVHKVENVFQVRMHEDDILNEDFYTLAGLSKILVKKLA